MRSADKIRQFSFPVFNSVSPIAHLGVAMRIWAGDALRHCRHRVARFLRLRTVVAHHRCHLGSHLVQWVRGFRLRAGSS